MEFYVTSSHTMTYERRQSVLTGTAAAHGHGKLRCAQHSSASLSLASAPQPLRQENCNLHCFIFNIKVET